MANSVLLPIVKLLAGPILARVHDSPSNVGGKDRSERGCKVAGGGAEKGLSSVDLAGSGVVKWRRLSV